MKKLRIRKGDIVGRKSYGKDILFIVDKFIRLNNKKEYAILKGMTIRIEADAPIEDLQLIDENIDENTLIEENKKERKDIEIDYGEI